MFVNAPGSRSSRRILKIFAMPAWANDDNVGCRLAVLFAIVSVNSARANLSRLFRTVHPGPGNDGPR